MNLLVKWFYRPGRPVPDRGTGDEPDHPVRQGEAGDRPGHQGLYQSVADRTVRGPALAYEQEYQRNRIRGRLRLSALFQHVLQEPEGRDPDALQAGEPSSED